MKEKDYEALRTGKEQKPKVMQEVSDNVDKLRAISTPAEEDWFKIAEEWEKEDKK